MARIVVLDPEDIAQPRSRHLFISSNLPRNLISQEAPRLVTRHPELKGMVFIEGQTAPATIPLECSYCNRREQRAFLARAPNSRF